MGLKNETRVIDGLEFRTSQLPALRALALSTRLGKVIAPMFDKLAGLDTDSPIGVLAPALADLFSRLEPAEAQALVCETLAGTSVILDEGKGPRLFPLNTPSAVDHVFSGRLRTMLAAVAFSVEVNFADFFDGASSAAPAAVGGESPTATGSAST